MTSLKHVLISAHKHVDNNENIPVPQHAVFHCINSVRSSNDPEEATAVFNSRASASIAHMLDTNSPSDDSDDLVQSSPCPQNSTYNMPPIFKLLYINYDFKTFYYSGDSSLDFDSETSHPPVLTSSTTRFSFKHFFMSFLFSYPDWTFSYQNFHLYTTARNLLRTMFSRRFYKTFWFVIPKFLLMIALYPFSILLCPFEIAFQGSSLSLASAVSLIPSYSVPLSTFLFFRFFSIKISVLLIAASLLICSIYFTITQSKFESRAAFIVPTLCGVLKGIVMGVSPIVLMRIVFMSVPLFKGYSGYSLSQDATYVYFSVEYFTSSFIPFSLRIFDDLNDITSLSHPKTAFYNRFLETFTFRHSRTFLKIPKDSFYDPFADASKYGPKDPYDLTPSMLQRISNLNFTQVDVFSALPLISLLEDSHEHQLRDIIYLLSLSESMSSVSSSSLSALRINISTIQLIEQLDLFFATNLNFNDAQRISLQICTFFSICPNNTDSASYKSSLDLFLNGLFCNTTICKSLHRSYLISFLLSKATLTFNLTNHARGAILAFTSRLASVFTHQYLRKTLSTLFYKSDSFHAVRDTADFLFFVYNSSIICVEKKISIQLSERTTLLKGFSVAINKPATFPIISKDFKFDNVKKLKIGFKFYSTSQSSVVFYGSSILNCLLTLFPTLKASFKDYQETISFSDCIRSKTDNAFNKFTSIMRSFFSKLRSPADDIKTRIQDLGSILAKLAKHAYSKTLEEIHSAYSKIDPKSPDISKELDSIAKKLQYFLNEELLQSTQQSPHTSLQHTLNTPSPAPSVHPLRDEPIIKSNMFNSYIPVLQDHVLKTVQNAFLKDLRTHLDVDEDSLSSIDPLTFYSFVEYHGYFAKGLCYLRAYDPSLSVTKFMSYGFFPKLIALSKDFTSLKLSPQGPYRTFHYPGSKDIKLIDYPEHRLGVDPILFLQTKHFYLLKWLVAYMTLIDPLKIGYFYFLIYFNPPLFAADLYMDALGHMLLSVPKYMFFSKTAYVVYVLLILRTLERWFSTRGQPLLSILKRRRFYTLKVESKVEPVISTERFRHQYLTYHHHNFIPFTSTPDTIRAASYEIRNNDPPPGIAIEAYPEDNRDAVNAWRSRNGGDPDSDLTRIPLSISSNPLTLTRAVKPKQVKVAKNIPQLILTILESWYPNLSFVYDENKSYNPHELSNILNAANRQDIISRIPKGKRVLVVGSDVHSWPVEGYVHCIPDISHFDSQRNIIRLNYIQQKRDEGIFIEYTQQPLSEIRSRFDVCIFVHSCYDIDFGSAFSKMFALGVHTVYNVMHYSSTLLQHGFCIIPEQNMSAHIKFKDSKLFPIGPPIPESVVFSQKGSNVEEFVHDYDNFVNWALQHVIQFNFSSTKLFFYERKIESNRLGTLISVYTLSENMSNKGERTIIMMSETEKGHAYCYKPHYTRLIDPLQKLSVGAVRCLPITFIEAIGLKFNSLTAKSREVNLIALNDYFRSYIKDISNSRFFPSFLDNEMSMIDYVQDMLEFYKPYYENKYSSDSFLMVVLRFFITEVLDFLPSHSVIPAVEQLELKINPFIINTSVNAREPYDTTPVNKNILDYTPSIKKNFDDIRHDRMPFDNLFEAISRGNYKFTSTTVAIDFHGNPLTILNNTPANSVSSIISTINLDVDATIRNAWNQYPFIILAPGCILSNSLTLQLPLSKMTVFKYDNFRYTLIDTSSSQETIEDYVLNKNDKRPIIRSTDPSEVIECLNLILRDPGDHHCVYKILGCDGPECSDHPFCLNEYIIKACLSKQTNFLMGNTMYHHDLSPNGVELYGAQYSSVVNVARIHLQLYALFKTFKPSLITKEKKNLTRNETVNSSSLRDEGSTSNSSQTSERNQNSSVYWQQISHQEPTGDPNHPFRTIHDPPTPHQYRPTPNIVTSQTGPNNETHRQSLEEYSSTKSVPYEDTKFNQLSPEETVTALLFHSIPNAISFTEEQEQLLATILPEETLNNLQSSFPFLTSTQIKVAALRLPSLNPEGLPPAVAEPLRNLQVMFLEAESILHANNLVTNFHSSEVLHPDRVSQLPKFIVVNNHAYAITGFVLEDPTDHYLDSTHFTHSSVMSFSRRVNGIIEAPSPVSSPSFDLQEITPILTPLDKNISLLFPKDFNFSDTLRNLDTILNSPYTNENSKIVAEGVAYDLIHFSHVVAKCSSLYHDQSPKHLHAEQNLAVYDAKHHTFIANEEAALGRHYAWVGGHIVSITWDSKTSKPLLNLPQGTSAELTSFIRSQQLWFINEEIDIIRDRNILHNVMHVFNKLFSTTNFSNVTMELIEGVPGAGKTTHIAQHYRKGDLCFTATRAAATTLRTMISKFHHISDTRYLNKYIRTYDSFLMNPNVQNSVIHCDEGLMVHPSVIILVSHLAKASIARVYGDRKQIPFISRVPEFTLRHTSLQFSNVTAMNGSWRLSKASCDFLRPLYPSIHSLCQTEGSRPTLTEIRGIQEISKNFEGLTLVFTQMEKTYMLKDGFKNVLTIHEAQGLTYKQVRLVRLMPQDSFIYSSIPHVIVGCSRHEQSFEYITIKPNDEISKIITSNSWPEFLEHKRTAVHTPILKKPSAPLKKRILFHISATPKLLSEPVVVKNSSLLNSSYSPAYHFRTVYSLDPSSLDQNETPEDYDDTMLDVVNQFIELNTHALPFGQRRLQMLQTPSHTSLHFKSVNYSSFLYYDAVNFDPDSSIRCTPLVAQNVSGIIEHELSRLMFAIHNRTANPPVLSVCTSDTLVKTVVDKFFSDFIDKDRFDSLRARTHPNNSVYFAEWYATRPASKRKDLIRNIDKYIFKEISPNKFKCFLKPMEKARFDNSHLVQLIAGQIITAQDPEATAFFTTLFKYFDYALKETIQDRWLIGDGLTIDEMSGHVNELLSRAASKVSFLEVDISKFDKSQGEFLLKVQLEILRRFGFPKFFLDYWWQCHLFNLLVFQSSGLRMYTQYQRRTGDVFTLIGNTLVAMIALSYAYDLTPSNVYGGLICGDDQLVLFKEQLIPDVSDRIAQRLNLHMKIEDTRNSIYFCSRFLIQSGNSMIFVPDPLKLLYRLSKTDVKSENHLYCCWMSFVLLTKYYGAPSVQCELERAVMARYYKLKYLNGFSSIVKFLWSLTHSYSSYRRLFKPEVSNFGKVKRVIDRELLFTLRSLGSEEDLFNFFMASKNTDEYYAGHISHSQDELNAMTDYDIMHLPDLIMLIPYHLIWYTGRLSHLQVYVSVSSPYEIVYE
uniref:Putative replicase n=1 Tax=Mohsystermes virus TaxID=2796615 RepID=A0A7T7K8W2_9VIRU|nr:putative replicase [Mohsystermes virus]